MSHEITERDRVESRDPAWHGLSEVKPEIVFEEGALDWTLLRQDLTYTNPITGEVIKFPSDAVVASDDGLPVGDKSVRCSYGIVQNRQLWDCLHEGLKDCPVPYEVVSAGSVKNRCQVFISIELNKGQVFKVGNREFQFILNILSSHDGSSRIIVLDSGICTICANTFSFNVDTFYNEDGAIRFMAKHSKNGGLKILDVSKGIGNLTKNRQAFCEQLEKLGDKKVTQDEALFFIVGFITPQGEDSSVSVRGMNVAEEMVQLFMNGAGNSGENRLDLFSSITDFHTHFSASRTNKSKQFISSEFGAGQVAKERAFQLLIDDDEFKKTVRRGELLITLQ